MYSEDGDGDSAAATKRSRIRANVLDPRFETPETTSWGMGDESFNSGVPGHLTTGYAGPTGSLSLGRMPVRFSTETGDTNTTDDAENGRIVHALPVTCRDDKTDNKYNLAKFAPAFINQNGKALVQIGEGEMMTPWSLIHELNRGGPQQRGYATMPAADQGLDGRLKGMLDVMPFYGITQTIDSPVIEYGLDATGGNLGGAVANFVLFGDMEMINLWSDLPASKCQGAYLGLAFYFGYLPGEKETTTDAKGAEHPIEPRVICEPFCSQDPLAMTPERAPNPYPKLNRGQSVVLLLGRVLSPNTRKGPGKREIMKWLSPPRDEVVNKAATSEFFARLPSLHACTRLGYTDASRDHGFLRLHNITQKWKNTQLTFTPKAESPEEAKRHDYGTEWEVKRRGRIMYMPPASSRSSSAHGSSGSTSGGAAASSGGHSRDHKHSAVDPKARPKARAPVAARPAAAADSSSSAAASSGAASSGVASSGAAVSSRARP
jgi:hypothetical protein